MLLLLNIDHYFFQKINSLAGHWLWLDTLGIFLANFLIWLLPILILIWYIIACPKKKLVIQLQIFKIILALILSWLIGQLIGFVHARPRPYLSYHIAHQLIPNVLHQSFPSGHTTFSFVLAFSILLINKKFGWSLVTLAFLIGLSRIFVGVHYPLDILGGILLAGLSTWLIDKIVLC